MKNVRTDILSLELWFKLELSHLTSYKPTLTEQSSNWLKLEASYWFRFFPTVNRIRIDLFYDLQGYSCSTFVPPPTPLTIGIGSGNCFQIYRLSWMFKLHLAFWFWYCSWCNGIMPTTLFCHHIWIYQRIRRIKRILLNQS